MREVSTEGLIYIEDDLGLVYKVAKITYVEREDETFEYAFEPCYSVIDLLDAGLFQGIPGLDLSLRKERYVRKDLVPVFISERTPGPAREDLQELLDACGMEYLNRLEWLIRTDTYYGGDHMLVRRWCVEDEKHLVNMAEICKGANRSSQQARRLLEAVCMGCDIEGDGFSVTDDNRANAYHLLRGLYGADRAFRAERQREGVKRAKAEKRYAGRKPVTLDLRLLDETCRAHLSGSLTAREAADRLGVSPATFYRRLKKLYPRGLD